MAIGGLSQTTGFWGLHIQLQHQHRRACHRGHVHPHLAGRAAHLAIRPDRGTMDRQAAARPGGERPTLTTQGPDRGSSHHGAAQPTGGGDHDTRPALGVYLQRLRREIATKDGPDVLVFTGGIGEPDPAVRAAAATGPGLLGVAIDEDSSSAAHVDGHGQRDPVRASARLAVTCSIVAFSAWQTSTRASCNRRPGSSTGPIGQAERDRGCQDQPSWQRHRLLTLETEERGGGHEIRGCGAVRHRGRPGQRLGQDPASSRRRYRCNRASGSRGTGRPVL